MFWLRRKPASRSSSWLDSTNQQASKPSRLCLVSRTSPFALYGTFSRKDLDFRRRSPRRLVNLTEGGLFRNRRATVRFRALELYGTIRPTECPPINGRMAKALRYLGFDVRGA